MMCGGSASPRPASPAAAAIQPACRPITSNTNTRVEVRAMEATSRAASRVETATYFATEPKPGQQSVCGRSLSTVFGTPTQVMGKPSAAPSCDTLRKSTRLNSSHVEISYAVFCLKKKKKNKY